MPLVARGIGDELGPDKIVLLREPRVGLEAVVVVDNVACGPAIGGVRMAPDVTVEEVSRLARAMTMKNAAAGLTRGLGGRDFSSPPSPTARIRGYQDVPVHDTLPPSVHPSAPIRGTNATSSRSSYLYSCTSVRVTRTSRWWRVAGPTGMTSRPPTAS